MQIGMIGLGRMGANMARRLLEAGHTAVVYNRHAEAMQPLVQAGAVGASSLAALVQALDPPRAVWMMVPAAVVDAMLADLAPMLAPNDIVIDGGNSSYHDDIRRAKAWNITLIGYVRGQQMRIYAGAERVTFDGPVG